MFPIIEVPAGSAEIYEQLGTKAKFWYQSDVLGRSLFKQGRPNTGENWAEKLACELAGMLGIPHAYYELARYEDVYGVVSPNFVPRFGRLVLGNEILAKAKIYPEHGEVRYYRSRAHTISAVMAFMKAATSDPVRIHSPKDFAPFDGVDTAGAVFAGYFLFDAWIGNQDRHDENWGLIADPADGKLYLAPSFDHGSSLARNETDAACAGMLHTKDRMRHISAYVLRARSAIYPDRAEPKAKSLLTFDVFSNVLKVLPAAGKAWLGRLALVSDEQIREAVGMLPDEFISGGRRHFVAEYLIINRERLLSLR